MTNVITHLEDITPSDTTYELTTKPLPTSDTDGDYWRYKNTAITNGAAIYGGGAPGLADHAELSIGEELKGRQATEPSTYSAGDWWYQADVNRFRIVADDGTTINEVESFAELIPEITNLYWIGSSTKDWVATDITHVTGSTKSDTSQAAAYTRIIQAGYLEELMDAANHLFIFSTSSLVKGIYAPTGAVWAMVGFDHTNAEWGKMVYGGSSLIKDVDLVPGLNDALDYDLRRAYWVGNVPSDGSMIDGTTHDEDSDGDDKTDAKVAERLMANHALRHAVNHPHEGVFFKGTEEGEELIKEVTGFKVKYNCDGFGKVLGVNVGTGGNLVCKLRGSEDKHTIAVTQNMNEWYDIQHIYSTDTTADSIKLLLG